MLLGTDRAVDYPCLVRMMVMVTLVSAFDAFLDFLRIALHS